MIFDTSYGFRKASGPLDEEYVLTISFDDSISEDSYYRVALREDNVFRNRADYLQLFDYVLFNGGSNIDMELHSLDS